MNWLQSTRLIIVVLCIFQSRIDGVTRTDDDDVKDQELQIKIQENERLQREVNMTKTNSKHQNTAGAPENMEVSTEYY